MTTDLTAPDELVAWVRRHAPAGMPEHVLPTLAVYAKAADEQGRGAHPTLTAVSAALGIPTRKVSRNLALLRDAGLLVLGEATDPELLAMPVHERPKVYDLGEPLRRAIAGPDVEPDESGGEPGRMDAHTSEAGDKEVQGAAGVPAIPNSANWLEADLIVRDLNVDGARLYGDDGNRMVRLVSRALANGWDRDELVAWLRQQNNSIFDPSAYLPFVMERNLTPPAKLDAIYRNEPVPAEAMTDIVRLMVERLNTPTTVFEPEQVPVAKGLLRTALEDGRTALDLMLILEQPTTTSNAGAELIARVRASLGTQPDHTGHVWRPIDSGNRAERHQLRDEIARTHGITFTEDQAHRLDYGIRLALLHGWATTDLLKVAAEPLDGLDDPGTELADRLVDLEPR